MTLRYIEKDITTVLVGVVGHGVNCQHAMGSGVAGAIRKRWPKVYEQFMKQPKGKTMLGCADPVYIDERDELIVVNCYTQVLYGYGGGKYADENAIEKSIMRTAQLADLFSHPLYLPKMGCGLGGLDWDTQVEPIFRKVAEKFDRIDIFVCNPPREISNGTNAT